MKAPAVVQPYMTLERRPVITGSSNETASTFSLVFAAWGVSLLANQAYSIWVFGLLSAALAGLLNWGTATATLAFYVLDGGVDTAAVVVSKQNPHSLRSLAYAVGALRCAGALIAVIAWLVATRIGVLHQPEGHILLLAGAGMGIRSVQTPFSAWLQARDHQAIVGALGMIHSLFRLSSLAALALTRQVSVERILLASLAADVAVVAATAVAARRVGAKSTHDLSAGELVRRIARAAPFLSATQILMMMQSRVDWLLVAAFVSYAGLANYALANKSLELIVLGGAVFGKVALPWFVDGWDSRGIGRPLFAVLSLATVAALVVGIEGRTLIHLAFGTKYSGATVLLPLMAALAPALMLLPIVQYAVQARGRASDTAYASFAGVTAQIVTDLLLIPRLGILGAGLGMCAFALVAVPTQLWMAVHHGIIPRRPALRLATLVMVAPLLLGIASRTY